MGMFDSVLMRCPVCHYDGMIYWQSKAGPCILNNYQYPKDVIPLAVLADIVDQEATCHECGAVLIPKMTYCMSISRKEK